MEPTMDVDGLHGIIHLPAWYHPLAMDSAFVASSQGLYTP